MKKILILLGFFCVWGVQAQTDIRNITFSGKVHDGRSGIAGVAVTDGINITHTDAKGKYSLLSNATAEFVYITLPSGYDIPLKDGIPYFYVPLTDKSKIKQIINFELKKSNRDDYRHTMLVLADPQIYFEEELPLMVDAAKDIIALSEQYETPVYGLVCGDIVGNHPIHYAPLKKIFGDTRIPFFFSPGNHDVTWGVRSNERSKEIYKQNFGPNYYSFKRGKVHYVVLDNSFLLGRSYVSYLTEQQLSWLQQDLASVPVGSTVIVVLHIPTSTRETPANESLGKVLQNRKHLHEMLQDYNAHIFSGHLHYHDNFVITDRLFEHVHAAICAEFWQMPLSSDGTPQGYGVFEITGENVKWYYKSVGYDKNFQFRSYPVGTNHEKPTAVTVNVWNWDPLWKVNWYENGILMGEMTQYRGHDPYTADHIKKHREKFRYNWISTGATEHFFYAEPSEPDVKIKIEVIDRFGNKYIEEL